MSVQKTDFSARSFRICQMRFELVYFSYKV